ncbi:helix-turn-helix domain-containing protein [Deinococcus rhizophilus]|uniref:helix-turn-helix domain-containing protein n=1 Tax=Deinococcus rhizophilus TaxID=3049544 RepID=UPI0038994FA8
MARKPRTYHPHETRLLQGIAARVFQARQAAGLSQEDLADRAHLSRSHISKIETSHSDPQITTLHRVARALGLSLQDLVTMADPAPDESLR